MNMDTSCPQVFGQEINNPLTVGLAAGFDKDGEAIDGMSNVVSCSRQIDSHPDLIGLFNLGFS